MEKLSDDNNKEGEAVQKLPSEPMHKASYKNISALDLNDPSKYKLLDLDQLDSKDYRNVYANITYLDVSRNSISSLKLKGYNLLETIVASDNSLIKVELNLYRLKKLNLNDNMIGKIFELNSIPLLEELLLNKNAVKNLLFEDFRPAKNTLINLELGQNRIDFQNGKEFFEFFDQFGKYMKKFKSMNIANNLFNSTQNKIFRDYADYIIYQCPFLKTMNGKMIDNSYRQEIRIGNIKHKILENEKEQGPKINKNLDKGDDSKYKGIVTLSIINNELEVFSQLGKMNKQTFKDLKKLVDMYLDTMKGEQQMEESNSSEDKEQIEFETLLEYSNILTDAHPSIEKFLIEMVAQFVIINNGKFSSRALSFLKQRLSPEKAKETEDIIDTFIIKPVCQCSEDNIFPAIIKGLEPFILTQNFSSIFNKLIERLIDIIKAFGKFKLFNTRSSEENPKKELYLAAVNFLSSASLNKDHCLIMINNEVFIESIITRVSSLLNETEEVISADMKGMEVLQKLLNLVRYMCMINMSEEGFKKNLNMNKLVGSGLRDKIEQNLNSKLQGISSKNETEKVNDSALSELIYNQKVLFANLIRCYGSLLFRTESIVKYVELKQSIPMKVINLLVQSEMNDPVLISSACDFTLSFLNNKQMKSNIDNIFEKFTKNLYNLRFVLPYLFQDRIEFRNACVIADKYGQKTLLRDKPESLATMNSEVINNLIISIVKLIEYFGMNSKKESKIRRVCTAICEDLNEQNRDFALCSCLTSSNEKVKLAIVEALYSTDYTQFSADEIFSILKQMKNINLTGGMMQRLVSIMFVILNKCFMDFLRQGKFDLVEQNKDAFFLAFEILFKNEERVSLKEENNINIPKAMLSMTTAIFLFNCSCFEQLKHIFQEAKFREKLPRILYYEQFPKGNCLPFEIEKTRTGCKIENLLDCFRNDNFAVLPYNYVSLRIMIHIADLLMGVSNSVYEINDSDDYQDILEELKRELSRRESDRIVNESKSLRKFVECKLENISNPNKNKILLSKGDLKEQQLQFLNAFPLILKYVLGESIPKSISHFTSVLEDKFDSQMDKVQYSTKYKLNKNDDEEFYDGELDDDINIYEDFKSHLREEEYYPLEMKKESVTEYDYIMNDLSKYFKYGMEESGLKRIGEEETPNNPYIRSLFIAALLRSILALLEYPADKSIKIEMIRILYQNDKIMKISKLADCTKLLDCNISSKYLILMRHVLMNSKIFFEKKNHSFETDNEYLNKVGVISYTIKKMIKIFKKELKLEDDGHKIFLVEVCRICSIIINEIEDIKFENAKAREKTLESMISYEIISLFIQTLKDYMNKESAAYKTKIDSDEDGEVAFSDDVILNEMVTTMSYIIGEYMSKCKKYSYTIIENFTRSFIFEGVKLRKSYLKEIMYYSKLSDLKSKISSELSIKVDFINRVHITDYVNETSSLNLLILTNTGLEFLNVNDPADERSDWQLEEFELKKKLQILFEDIEAIIWFELLNRILVKTVKGYFGMFFYKTHITSLLIPIIKINNSKINIYEKVPILIDEDNFDKEDEANKTNKGNEGDTPEPNPKDVTPAKPSDKYQMVIEETPDSTSDTPEIEERKFEIKEVEIELGADKKKEKVVVFCVSVVKKFFDFFTKMFKKFQLVKEGKVLIIKKDKLILYQEDFEQWGLIAYNSIFEKAMKYPSCKGLYLGDFSMCYNYLVEYDLNGIENFITSNVDIIDMKFASGDDLNIRILDDISYVKLKRAIYPFLKLNKVHTVKDDYYDDIK